MWYWVEQVSWITGMVLQAILLAVMVRWQVARKRPWFFSYIAYGLLFSLVLLGIDHIGAHHGWYRWTWNRMQAVNVFLLGAAVVEALDIMEEIGLATLLGTMTIGSMLATGGHERVLIMSAMVCFVGAAALALARREWWLVIYLVAHCVEHMAVLWNSAKWHAGAYSQIVSAACYAAWICQVKRKDLANIGQVDSTLLS